MKNNTDPNPASKWLSVPLIATITRLLCRELTLQNEYLRRKNKILKSKINKKIVFTDDERRTLVESALAMGKDLMEKVVTIVQPKTIFAWQRKLEQEKWDYTDRRKNNPCYSSRHLGLLCTRTRRFGWGRGLLLMSASARSPYGQQDVANSDLRHPGYIMNLEPASRLYLTRIVHAVPS